MPLACPQCKQVFEQNGICPLCNVVLMYHATTLQSQPAASSTDEDAGAQWQQTPWGRILVGLILAQGLSFGLSQMLTAGFLAAGDGADSWQTLWGIVLHHAIHVISLILGGALTGAGQPRGIIYGSFVGFTSGIITFFFRGHTAEAFSTSVLIYAEPIMHLALGALGGALGMLIWRPAPELPELEGTTPTPGPTVPWGFSLGNAFVGPVHLGRVCAGAFVIVVGVVWSEAILGFLLRASNGTLSISSHLQAQLVSLEISAIAAIIGAAFAGATTKNGLKQGLCVGFGAAVIVLGIQIGGPRFAIESAVFTISGIIAISLVGGWFGGQLFPPLAPNRRKINPY